MSVGEVVFYLLGGLAVASSVLVITSRNPVASLLFLVLSFFCLAGLFATLEAHFLAAIQILVYAGAILVLFLFVIMLLNLGLPERRFGGPRPLAVAVAFAAAAGFVVVLAISFRGAVALPPAEGVVGPAEGVVGPAEGVVGSTEDAVGSTDGVMGSTESVMGSTESVGLALFRDFLLPFEVTSLLLLVAMVGAVVLAKRER